MATQKLSEAEDLIADILSRLPVKCLLRFRCVCKSWCALITDKAFVKTHLSRSPAINGNRSLIFINSSHFYSMDLDACEQEAAVVEFDHPLKSAVYGTTEVLGSCNGLLCIFENPKKDIFLWHPSTRRHQKLPFKPIEFPIELRIAHLTAYGFGHDPTTDDYKLVRVVQFYVADDNYLHSKVEVYSLSTNSWRRIGDMPFLPIEPERPFGVLANAVLHWDATNAAPPSGSMCLTGRYWIHTNSFILEKIPCSIPRFIVSFGLKHEEYRELSLPDSVNHEAMGPWGFLEDNSACSVTSVTVLRFG